MADMLQIDYKCKPELKQTALPPQEPLALPGLEWAYSVCLWYDISPSHGFLWLCFVVHSPVMQTITACTSSLVCTACNLQLAIAPSHTQARNLLKAGFEVTVWNRTPERCSPLQEAGATMAPTAGEAVACSDITFATLSTPEAALEVGAEVAGNIRQGAAWRSHIAF